MDPEAMSSDKPARTVRGRPFAKGPDLRRHILTFAERQRGGRTSWKRYMRRWYAEITRPVPIIPLVEATYDGEET
jgi:hypothetical protein